MIYLAAIAARPINLIAALLILLQTVYLYPSCSSFEVTTTNQPEPKTSNCNIFKYLGVNDLSVNDIVVKSMTGNMACIKARFSLAIKVEEAPENRLELEEEQHPTNHTGDEGTPKPVENGYAEEVANKRLLLGYVPLDSVISVEDSCPNADPDSVPKEGHQAEKGGRLILSEPRELEMIVHFECGKLAFSFKREDNYYVSSIRGVVNLDANTIREFASEEPMLFTSDLTHHFRFNDLIEVNSSAKTKAFILTANFYNLEFETFRNTSSRGFIRPADDNSKPFS